MILSVPQFVRSHGLGNDYIVVDPARVPFALTPAAVRILCDRHRGIGSDGILAVAPSSGADFGVRIFNPAGSEAEKSGNGIRIFAKYLREHGYTSADRFTVDTPGGRVAVVLHSEGDRVREVTADMGVIRFDERGTIDVDGQPLSITSLSIGNPHCVVIIDDLSATDAHRLGPLLERHPAFPHGTNVQLAQVLTRERIRIEIWERGAGYTLASGTSSCAAAAACHRRGLTGRVVTVVMPGGELAVTIGDGYAMRLRGPVEEIEAGDLSPDLLGRLSALGS